MTKRRHAAQRQVVRVEWSATFSELFGPLTAGWTPPTSVTVHKGAKRLTVMASFVDCQGVSRKAKARLRRLPDGSVEIVEQSVEFAFQVPARSQEQTDGCR